jgi:hypothetical protein
MKILPAALLGIVTLLGVTGSSAVRAQDDDASAPPAQTSVAIAVDAAVDRHPISPMIYGVSFGSKEQLALLGSLGNRSGGNNMSRYNWQLNAHNIDNDWYFESVPDGPATPGASVDDFIADTRAAGAQPMVTIPMVGWVAKLGPDRSMLPSFSVAKYGPQQKADPNVPDGGNGVKPDGKTNVANNDPNDADVPSTPDFQKGWVQHLVEKWGGAAKGGVRYYVMDNEPSLWQSTHRDVHPQGETMDEERDDLVAYATMVKNADPAARILGPEEWGWPGYFASGADGVYAAAHNYQGHPDKDAHGGMDYIPWLLDQLRQHEAQTKQRLLDILTVHYYPQSGEFGDDDSSAVQLLRNQSTRSLWDPDYTDQSWIKDKVYLIPRLKGWVAKYYPGLKIGITEYNWGAENSIGGATAEADVLGIFGREGLDLACRWEAPAVATPTFKAMQMYRNYDGAHSTFGDVSVSDRVPDPDTLSSFAALRQRDGALTVIVIDKSLDRDLPISMAFAHYAAQPSAEVWQLTSSNNIDHLTNVDVHGGRLTTTVPAQSVTLFVIPAAIRPHASSPSPHP